MAGRGHCEKVGWPYPGVLTVVCCLGGWLTLNPVTASHGVEMALPPGTAGGAVAVMVGGWRQWGASWEVDGRTCNAVHACTGLCAIPGGWVHVRACVGCHRRHTRCFTATETHMQCLWEPAHPLGTLQHYYCIASYALILNSHTAPTKVQPHGSPQTTATMQCNGGTYHRRFHRRNTTGAA